MSEAVEGSPLPLLSPIGGYGRLGATVWPTYIGVSAGDPGPPGRDPIGEPFEDLNYQRGMMTWHTEPDGRIWGSGRIYAPAGVYTHYVFCHGPIRNMMIGSARIEGDPIIFNRPGIIDAEPIANMTYLPRLPA